MFLILVRRMIDSSTLDVVITSEIIIGIGVVLVFFAVLTFVYVVRIALEVGFRGRGIPRVALISLFYSLLMLVVGVLLIYYKEKMFIVGLALILMLFLLIVEILREIYRALKILIYG